MSQGNEGARELGDQSFTLRSERTDAGERIRLSGEMDLSVVGQVDREMSRAESTDAAEIILDLDELVFLDASGVRLLLTLNDRSRSNGDRLRIKRARSRHVQRVIELTGVEDALPFVD
jgi:stage II sporulation protein AA (anti-sigma F factor antagonist)